MTEKTKKAPYRGMVKTAAGIGEYLTALDMQDQSSIKLHDAA